MPRPHPSRTAPVVALLAVAAASTTALVCGAIARRLNGPQPPNPYGFTPFEVQADHEDVTFTAGDGVRLAGWWFDRPDSDWVLICCHGHRGAKADLLGIGPGLWRAGHTVFLFDFRGSGDSYPGRRSLGWYERADLRAALELARRRRPQARIGIVAFSMGAAVAIQVAADDPVDALVLDSPFATAAGVVAQGLRSARLPTALLPLVSAACRVGYGYRLSQVRPVDRIAALAPTSVLIMHGGRDPITPVRHAHALFAAAGDPKELVIFDEAGHCGGYFADRGGYVARVSAYFDGAHVTRHQMGS